MKCIYCNTEPNKPILDEGLKVCCCLMFQKKDGIYTQYYRDGKITHPTEKEGVENMTKDKYKIQIGDVLYQASKSYNKIFEWKVLDIWFEDYIGGNKTIVKCSNGTWSEEFFVSQILEMCRNREEAEQKLKEMRGKNGNL